MTFVWTTIVVTCTSSTASWRLDKLMCTRVIEWETCCCTHSFLECGMEIAYLLLLANVKVMILFKTAHKVQYEQ